MPDNGLVPNAGMSRRIARPPGAATHVVLVQPEIHWNTGNAGRTCLATGSTLHLIEPLGFSLDEREVKRAGLDYWEHVDLHVWPSWDAFERQLPDLGDAYFFRRRPSASIGTRRSARRKAWCSCSAGKRRDCRRGCTSDIVIGFCECPCSRRWCVRSICRRVSRWRCTRCCDNGRR